MDNSKNGIDVIECTNDFKCWECNKDCDLKRIFLYDDQTFYSILNRSTKSLAGMMLVSGYSLDAAEKVKTEFTLMLVIARNEYLKKIRNQ